MTENERKIAELNRIYKEIESNLAQIEKTINETYSQRYQARERLENVSREREKLLGIEFERLTNLN